MNYFSTNNQSSSVNFKDATIKGLAPDKGLYFPEMIPEIESEFFKNITQFSKEEIAFKVIEPYVGNVIPADELRRIVAETVNFDFPLIAVEENIFSLELFHGPTLAFKDVGARFMSRCLSYFVKDNSRKVTVLVATSGDTGGAVANGFYDAEGVDVVILYPSGKVSSVQELQLTTLGKNIRALEVDGTFDDCQSLVKQAFADESLNKEIFLTSANSINVARWLSQQFYYFFAYQAWPDKNNPPVISVPSGNFGNICAGLLAHRTGLPVSHFIAACNANKVFTDYLQTQNYSPTESIATISNAMDVGSPSNFVRILQLFNNHFPDIKNLISSYSITDDETRKAIQEAYVKSDYLMDPHGAVAYVALKKYLQNCNNKTGLFLETAHPVKFYDVVEPVINEKISLPDSVKELLKLKKRSTKLAVNYKDLQDYLLSF
jgi:threonine synthase